jgi:hypothetical protein
MSLGTSGVGRPTPGAVDGLPNGQFSDGGGFVPLFPPRLRELGLRPGLDLAELAAADRRSLAGDADGGRGTHPRAHRRCAGFAEQAVETHA